MLHFRTWCAVLVLAAVASVVAVAADDDASPAPKIVDTRVYDIRDLIAPVPNLPLTRKRVRELVKDGQAWILRDSYGHSSREEMIEQLITLIQDTVGKQEHWAAYGGDVSNLRELNGNLIVKTEFRYHKDVETLLSQLRAAQMRQVAVDAYYLHLPTRTLDAFKRDHADGTPVLSEKAADKLVELATANQQDIRIVGTIRLLGMNDQRVHAIAVRPGAQQASAGAAASKPRSRRACGSEPAANEPADQPKQQAGAAKPVPPDEGTIHVERSPGIQIASPIRTARGATALDVEPAISHDGKFIRMVVRTAVTTAASGDGVSDGEAGAINTTVAFPNRGGVLLGCASHRVADDDNDPAGDRELILLLRARAVEVEGKGK